MPSLSLVSRTLAVLRDDPDLLSYRKVETWNFHARRRIDFYGGDVIVLYPMRILLIQVSDMHNRAAHVKGAIASQEVLDWLVAGGDFEVWAWRKLEKGGWQYDSTPFDLSMMRVPR